MRGTRLGRSKPSATIFSVFACSGTSCTTAVVPPDWRQLKFVATTSISENSLVNAMILAWNCFLIHCQQEETRTGSNTDGFALYRTPDRKGNGDAASVSPRSSVGARVISSPIGGYSKQFSGLR